MDFNLQESGVDSQLPCAVTELGTSLADMEMKNLVAAMSAIQPGVSRIQLCVAKP